MPLDWLTVRPVAHRGLHDAAAGMIENMPAAFSAAVAANFGMECDIQISADGEAMVHHDHALGRLTEGSGPLADLKAAALKQVTFKATTDRMLTLGELCDLVGGRTPLVIEIKSRFDGDMRLATRAVEVLKTYSGPAVLMSFDPAPIEHVRAIAPGVVRGIVFERHYVDAEWRKLTPLQKASLAHLLHAPSSRPQFLAYHVEDLPAAAPLIARNVLGLPLLTWTVRTAQQRATAARWADQMIFEGFRP
jgi:glycerophosphoryl diester phosphodiesterase